MECGGGSTPGKPPGSAPVFTNLRWVTHYALYHLFGPDVRDRNGHPICEVYAFDETDDLEEWLLEVGLKGERVNVEHPTIKALLGPSQVFEIETPFRTGDEEGEESGPQAEVELDEIVEQR